MARDPSVYTPKYRRHKASGRAVVTLSGQDVYLGNFGTAASKRAYQAALAEWNARGRRAEPTPEEPTTIAELAAAFYDHAKIHYRRIDGSHTGEHIQYKYALRLLKASYADLPAQDFGRDQLKALREQMIAAKGWARTTINKHIIRLRHVFNWGTDEGLVPVGVLQRLKLKGLEPGRSLARETQPRRSVPPDVIAALEHELTPHLWAAVQLMLHSGMRVSELLNMRGRDLEFEGDVIFYRPPLHKTSHRQKIREIIFGPVSQAFLRPYLKLDPEQWIFQPRISDLEHRERRAAKRKTPAGQGNRPGSNRRAKPDQQPGRRYSFQGFRQAIVRACDRAGVARWTPRLLRKNAATNFRAAAGAEASQIALGHSHLDTTEIYAERDRAAQMRLARMTG